MREGEREGRRGGGRRQGGKVGRGGAEKEVRSE